MILETFEKILYDLEEPIGYLPAGIAAAVLMMAFLMFGKYLFSLKSLTKKKITMAAVLAGYLAVVAVQTYFSREPGSRTGIDLVLFSTWGTTAQAHAYVIENIILFLPLGVLLPLTFPAMRSWYRTTGMGLLLSVVIEGTQLMTSRGHCQADDVMTNTLGAWIGFLIFKALWKCTQTAGSRAPERKHGA